MKLFSAMTAGACHNPTRRSIRPTTRLGGTASSGSAAVSKSGFMASICGLRVRRHQIVKKGRRILWGGFRRVVARARKGIDVIPCKRPRFKSLLVGGQILPQAVEFLVRPVPTELLQRCGHWLKPVKRARDYARA